MRRVIQFAGLGLVAAGAISAVHLKQSYDQFATKENEQLKEVLATPEGATLPAGLGKPNRTSHGFTVCKNRFFFFFFPKRNASDR
jgi:hypothetical protein